ncbi:hypothetical protein PO073_09260 [Bacteroides thetaiotaomicron]|jgi:hypothetical protein|uniref:hypothetical protein n=1 Tax=Bacteroides thetaiotaomicron TaxID=818 RepID=UPI00189D500B|nr:hypothetical protein [Bacteroides thetaiotaomicron]MDC2172609.1 hypothetical protein [Bacteroides thetaiotaomicron]MDC2187837.1 hypothetical protein [Bacteroides thetaiotaomicron]
MKAKEINIIQKVTRLFVITLTIGTLNHGTFETLQGFHRAPGIFINDIGENIRFGELGTQEAMTLIPNFGISGLVIILLSISVLVFSFTRITSKWAPIVILCFFYSNNIIRWRIWYHSVLYHPIFIVDFQLEYKRKKTSADDGLFSRSLPLPSLYWL